MEAKTLQIITNELYKYGKLIKEDEVKEVVELCQKANRIFIAGAGRSGFCARGFANRMMHLGFTVYFVGETTTPSIQEGDLLIVGSGSGTTASLVSDCKKAKAQKATIATLTICPEAPIGEMADAIITIPGATQKNAEHTNDVVTEQPGGNLFEQLSWLIYDSIVMDLMPILGETEDTMFKHGVSRKEKIYENSTSKDSEIWFSVKCNGYAKYRCIHWMGPFNSTVY